MAAPSKQYGLIFPKKTQQKALVKHAVFMEDSDEESSVGESLQREALKKQAMKQTKLEIQRALAEDATVYEYDNIYEDIQQKKVESHSGLLAGKGEKKPKYIQNILKAAELRKKEQEKRMEKKIQKEREMEGGAFDDKEAFVTSAYKKKLQERAEEEERERREAAVEACLDVTKQKDLSGFYRHLLNQAVGEEEAPLCSLRGARLKEEPTVNLNSCKEMKKSQEGGERSQHLAQEKDNPDADSDLDAESSGDEGLVEVQAPGGSDGRRESRPIQTDQRRETSRHPKGRRESRSSSEERRPHPKGPTSGPEREDGAHRKEKGGHPRERDSEKRHRERGKEECSRSEDRHRRRHGEAEEKEEERQKKKDRKERDDYRRELRKQKDKEDKYSEWEQQEREEQRNHGERDKGAREGKHRRPVSPGQDGHQAPGRQAGKDGLPDSEQPPELKDKTLGEGTEQEGKPPAAAQNKFAKRSSQESITSARDRYLARQMARVGAKPYVEEED